MAAQAGQGRAGSQILESPSPTVLRVPRAAKRGLGDDGPESLHSLVGAVKEESMSPVKPSARYHRRGTSGSLSAGANRGRRQADPPVPILEIPDSSSEGEPARSLAKKVLARSSPKDAKCVSAQAIKEARKYRLPREKDRWVRGATGRDELDLTRSSSPSAATTSARSDTDTDSDVVIISSSRPRRGEGSLQRGGSLTTAGALPSPSAAASPRRNIEPHADSERDSSRSGCASLVTHDTTDSEVAGLEAIPPRSPERRSRGVEAGWSHSQVSALAVTSSLSSLPPSIETSSRVSVGPAPDSPASMPRRVLLGTDPSNPPTPSSGHHPSNGQSDPDTDSAATFLTAHTSPVAAAAAAALLHTSPRRDGSLPRSPESSGSPLSSLGSSPQRVHSSPSPPPPPALYPASARSTATAGPMRQRKRAREPMFELMIEPPARRVARSGSVAVVTGAIARRAMRRPPGEVACVSTRTTADGKRDGEEARVRKDREGDMSEWDAFMQDGSQDQEQCSGDGRNSVDEEGPRDSPSPARKPKTRRASPSHDSAVESDDHSSVDGGSSDSTDSSASDAEDFAALLAAARARREANGGTPAVASALEATQSPHTTETTVSPPADQKPVVRPPESAGAAQKRRSSRTRHAPDFFSPSTATGTGALLAGSTSSSLRPGPGPVARLPPALGLVSRGPGGRGAAALTFDKIMREREAQVRRGRGQEWLEGWKQALERDSGDEWGSSDEDLDNRSDASDAMLSHPSMLNRSLVASALRGSDSNDEDHLPRPMGKTASRQAKAVERVLGEEREAERQRAAGGETRGEREGRRVWTDEEVTVDELDTTGWRGTGWTGKVAEALRGLNDLRSFPSSLSLCSSLASPSERGLIEEQRVVAGWLLTTILHPSTPQVLADRLTILLRRTAMCAARALAAPVSVLLDATHLVKALESLGARLPLVGKAEEPSQVKVDADMEAHAHGETPTPKAQERRQRVPVDAAARHEMVGRWCLVVQALSGTSPRLLSDVDVARIVHLVVILSLDPTTASLRTALEWTLRLLLASIPPEFPARLDILCRLVDSYALRRPGLQLAVLQAIPHDREANEGLRRWLAWAFLAGVKAEDLALPLGGFTASVLPNLVAFLAAPPVQSPFHRRVVEDEGGASTARDTAIADSTRILFIALTSLDLYLLASPARVEECKHLMEIITHVQSLDHRLRADARKGLAVERLVAKNLLTALAQSAMHQLRSARGQSSGGFGFSEEEERTLARRFEGVDRSGREAKRAWENVLADGAGLKQTTLSFCKAGSPDTPATGAQPVEGEVPEHGHDHQTVGSDEEVEEALTRW